MKTFQYVMSVSEYQKSRPDYLRNQFPREIAGWNRFSQREQRQLVQWEIEALTRDGYIESPDGSFAKPLR